MMSKVAQKYATRERYLRMHVAEEFFTPDDILDNYGIWSCYYCGHHNPVERHTCNRCNEEKFVIRSSHRKPHDPDPLKVYKKPKRKTTNLDRLVKIVADHYAVGKMDVRYGKWGTHRETEARHVAMYLAHTEFGMPVIKVARKFGGQNKRNTYINIKNIRYRSMIYDEMKQTISELRSAINQKLYSHASHTK